MRGLDHGRSGARGLRRRRRTGRTRRRPRRGCDESAARRHEEVRRLPRIGLASVHGIDQGGSEMWRKSIRGIAVVACLATLAIAAQSASSRTAAKPPLEVKFKWGTFKLDDRIAK